MRETQRHYRADIPQNLATGVNLMKAQAHHQANVR